MATATRALITRPLEDAKPVAARLADLGIDAVIEPLLFIDYKDDADVAFDGVQALLFTSANGVRALARNSDERSLPVLTVGDASAREARVAGFADVTSAGGDVEDLAALAMGRLKSEDGILLHIAGSAVAGDLAGRLEQAGFAYRRAVLYGARTADALSYKCVRSIRDGQIDAALFFSPRTAATFVRLAQAQGLSPHCRSMDAVCLSAAVAETMSELPWQRCLTAREPTLDALLDILDEDA